MQQNQDKLVKKDSKQDKIPFSQLVAYGFGGIIPIALFNIAGQLMGLIGNISLGLSAMWLGIILIIPRLWDAVSDPIVGHFSDNIRTKWGRRRPFLLVGGISVAISFVLMWWIPDGEFIHQIFPTESSYKWFQLVYILFWLLIFFTACTIFEIPHGALGMEMSNDPHERTRLFSAKSFLGNLFAMSTPWLFALANMEYFKGAGGNEADGMKYVSIAVAFLLIPLSFWWFYSVKEPSFKKVAVQKKTKFWKDIKRVVKNKAFIKLVSIVFILAMGFNFVNLLGYYIPIYYIFDGNKEVASTLLGINGTIWAVTGLIAVFPLNWISPKLGKRKTLLIAIALMSLAQLSKIVCYNNEYPYLIIIPTVFLSTGMLFFFTLGSSMVGDICDQDDLETNKRSEGSFYSIFWWFIKMGTAFASFVAGLLIVFTQFDENQVTKVDDFKGSINTLVNDSRDFIENEKEVTANFTDQLNNLKNKTIEKLEKDVLFNKKSASELLENNTSCKTILLENESIILYYKKIAERQLNSNSVKQDIHLFQKRKDTLISIYLKASLNALKFKSQILKNYFKSEIIKNDETSAHYSNLNKELKLITNKIRLLDQNTLKTDIKELNNIFEDSKKLTKQSHYTLFMMRAVEIGLPLLLCLISFIITFKYPLTEERIYEIKMALDKRNQENQDIISKETT